MKRNKKSAAQLTNEDVGVTLPFSQLVSAMLLIMTTGLVIVVILSWGVIVLIEITPASLFLLVVWIIAAPLVFWALYFIYLGVTVLVTHAFLQHYEKKSPAMPRVLKRQFKDKNHPDYILLHYYHLRGAIVKYSLWITQKCPFPSLLARVLHYYGHNEIGKRVMYENCFPGLEFTRIGDNVVMEVGTALSTHVVESLYGNLVIARVSVDADAVVGINSVVGPGITVAAGFQMGDNNMAYRNWPLVKQPGNDSTFFNGSPSKQCGADAMFADGDLKQQYLAAREQRA
jgi:acetyltransferase-like isoleucine patch superfamily enzyme